ncbi:MAG TPA: hypothetical protein VGD58_27815 [Herpetosiphonaceae bacterium]
MATVIDLLRHLGERAAPDGGNALAGPVMLPAVTDSPLSLPLPPAIVGAWARLVGRKTLGHHALALSAAQTQRSVALMGHGASPHDDLLLLLLSQLQRPPHPAMLALMPPDESTFRQQLITLAEATGVRWLDAGQSGGRVAQAQLILATPSDLHRRVLRYHDRAWRWLWPQLRFVALPQLHRYTSAEAGHLHWLLRRVERLATHSPLQLLSSLASVADVGGTLNRLLDRPMHVVAAPDGPSHSVLIALWRCGSNREATLLQLAEQLSARHLAITVFGRDEAETIQLRAQATKRGIALPDEVRVAIVAGVPRAIDDRQQLLRSGYRLLILLAGDEPHELLFAAQPDLLLNALPQWPLATHNPYVVAPQLTCAAVEHPLEEAEIDRWAVRELRDRLIKKNVLQPLPSGDLWQSAPDIDEPYAELDPRAIGGEPLTILSPAGESIATIPPALQDRCLLERQVFEPGWQVAGRDESGLVVQLAPDPIERDTIVLAEMTVRVRDELAARTIRFGKQTTDLLKGKVWASQRIVGLRELRPDATERRLPASAPQTEWLAAACWIPLSGPIGDPQAIGWTITQALPIVALAPPAALAVTYDAEHERLYLIEVEPGGVGIIDCLYQEFETLIELASLIAQSSSTRPLYKRLVAAELAWINGLYGRAPQPEPIQEPQRAEQPVLQPVEAIKTPVPATPATPPKVPVSARPEQSAPAPRLPAQLPKAQPPVRSNGSGEQAKPQTPAPASTAPVEQAKPKAPAPTPVPAKPETPTPAPTTEQAKPKAPAPTPARTPIAPAARTPAPESTPAPTVSTERPTAPRVSPTPTVPTERTPAPESPPAPTTTGEQARPQPRPAVPARETTPVPPQRLPIAAPTNGQRAPTPAPARAEQRPEQAARPSAIPPKAAEPGPTIAQRPAEVPRRAEQPAPSAANTPTTPAPVTSERQSEAQKPAAAPASERRAAIYNSAQPPAQPAKPIATPANTRRYEMPAPDTTPAAQRQAEPAVEPVPPRSVAQPPVARPAEQPAPEQRIPEPEKVPAPAVEPQSATPVAETAPPPAEPEDSPSVVETPAVEPQSATPVAEASEQPVAPQLTSAVEEAPPAEQRPQTIAETEALPIQPRPGIERRPSIVDRLELDQEEADDQPDETATTHEQAEQPVAGSTIEEAPPADEQPALPAPVAQTRQPHEAVPRRRITSQYSIDDLLPPLDDEEEAEEEAFIEEPPAPPPEPFRPALHSGRASSSDVPPRQNPASRRPEPEIARNEPSNIDAEDDEEDERPVERYPARREPQPPRGRQEPPTRQPFQRREPQRPLSSPTRQSSPPAPRREPPAPQGDRQRPYQARGSQNQPPQNPSRRVEPPTNRRDPIDQRSQRPQRQEPPAPPQREPRRPTPPVPQKPAAPEPEADVNAMIARMRRLREEREASQRPATTPRTQRPAPTEPVELRFHIGERVQCLPYGVGTVRASSIVDGREQVLIDFPEYGEIEVDPALNLIRQLGSSAAAEQDEHDDI